jgi:hypothetical protein
MLVDNAGGKIYNSIFADFAGGIVVEDLADANVGDSRQRLETGDLLFKNNIFTNVADNTFAGIAAVAPNQGYLTDHLSAAANKNIVTTDPVLASIGRQNNKGLNPLAASGSAALSGATMPEGSFFKNVNYAGAFDGANNWMKGWTYIDQLGYLQ